MKHFLYFLVIAFLLPISGCVKGDFDEPSVTGEDPNIPEEMIVALPEVMDKLITDQIIKVDMDKYVKAIVIADDVSGSFYKTLVIEDENSDLGIAIIIDDNNLAAKFPIGRRVFIHLRDLWISDFAGLPQLGYGPFDDEGEINNSRIPGVLANDIVIRGQYGLNVEPTTIDNINLLGNSQLNTLIQIENVQFSQGSIGSTFADAVLQLSVNHTVEDCNGNEITLRVSGFTGFAGSDIPSGNGTLTAVYGIFGNTRQLTIRDLNDLTLVGDRCGDGGISGTQVTIKSVRESYNSGATSGEDGFIEGVVISDFTNNNITGRNLVLQDESAGIVVRFEDNHSYRLGDKIQVSTNGVELSEFNGIVQLNNVSIGETSFVGTGTIEPKEVSISDILQDFEDYESTLVLINEPSISGGTTFAGNLTVSDNSGSITMFTWDNANFSAESVPTTIKTLVGIIGEYSNPDFTPQIQMRSIEDIDGEGGGGPTTTEGVEEAFNGGSDNLDIDITGWDNVATKGERRWQKKTFEGNGYAQATAFNDMNAEMETWLISPEVDATKYSTLSFETAQAFYAHQGLSVWVTDNYSGDPTSTTWTELEDAELAGSGSAEHAWVMSGDLSISSYGTKARIGFKYVGSGSGNTTSYRVDNVKVK